MRECHKPSLRYWEKEHQYQMEGIEQTGAKEDNKSYFASKFNQP